MDEKKRIRVYVTYTYGDSNTNYMFEVRDSTTMKELLNNERKWIAESMQALVKDTVDPSGLYYRMGGDTVVVGNLTLRDCDHLVVRYTPPKA